MTGSYLELAIIAFILMALVIVIWRGGQANPESTGKLSSQLGTLKRELDGVDARSRRTADDVEGVKLALAERDRKLDQALRQIAGMQAAIAEHRATSEHTRHQVDRLYDFIVERGIGK